jgi:hypothetical protein
MAITPHHPSSTSQNGEPGDEQGENPMGLHRGHLLSVTHKIRPSTTPSAHKHSATRAAAEIDISTRIEISVIAVRHRRFHDRAARRRLR